MPRRLRHKRWGRSSTRLMSKRGLCVSSTIVFGDTSTQRSLKLRANPISVNVTCRRSANSARSCCNCSAWVPSSGQPTDFSATLPSMLISRLSFRCSDCRHLPGKIWRLQPVSKTWKRLLHRGESWQTNSPKTRKLRPRLANQHI